MNREVFELLVGFGSDREECGSVVDVLVGWRVRGGD